MIKRKHMCAVWFPYTLLDRLQTCLSKSSDIGVREKLQGSLKSALQNHFKQVRLLSQLPLQAFSIAFIVGALEAYFHLGRLQIFPVRL